MTVIEFHKERRMFIVIDGTLLIAPESCELTHAEWIKGIFFDQWAWITLKYTRGYVLNDKLCAYIGDDFSTEINHDSIITVLKQFPQVKHIGLGAIKSNIQPWPPKVTYTVETYKEVYNSGNFN